MWDEGQRGVAERGKQRVTPVVSAKKLGKRFGRTVGLATFDLELAKGVSLALLGPNGAGKSTLLRLIAGLARPTSGSLDIDGVSAHKGAARAKVGYIGHASHLYPDLTARENLIFAAKLHGVGDPAARATQLLAEEGLERAADRQTRGFSRGMAQRLAIARGLIQEPEIVLLDEPFTGLDRAGRKWLGEFLLSFKARGGALVVATHSFDAGMGVADRVAILAGGRIVLDRPAAALGLEDLRRLYDELAMGPGTAS